MTITETRPEIGLEILESLDFDPEHDCEHYNHGKVPWHSGPAKYLVAISNTPCLECGSSCKVGTIGLCKPAWERAGTTGLHCVNDDCSRRWLRSEAWTIVATL